MWSLQLLLLYRSPTNKSRHRDRKSRQVQMHFGWSAYACFELKQYHTAFTRG